MEIAVQKCDVELFGAFDRGIAFSADTSDPVMFAMVFDKLYTHKIRSICREILSNAYDAMIEAGTIDQPIDIHLPTYSSPSLIIKDRGNGMSDRVINDVFSVCFKSTKRGDNRQIGGYGIGAKSPFAYTSMFTIDSAHNGVTTRYVAYKGEDNVPRLIKSASSRTDDSGVTITMPVDSDDIATVFAELSRLTPYFTDATIHLYRDQQFVEVAKKISYVTVNDHYGIRHDTQGPQVVMANISFPIDVDQPAFAHATVHGIDIRLIRTTPVDIFVDNGSIDLSASRETLAYTPRTLDVVIRKIEQVFSQAATTLANTVTYAPTWWDAFVAINKPIAGVSREMVTSWLKHNNDLAQKHGKPIPPVVQLSMLNIGDATVLMRDYARSGKPRFSTTVYPTTYAPHSHLDKRVVFIENGGTKTPSTVVARVRRWLATQQDIHGAVIASVDRLEPLVGSANIIKYNDLTVKTTKQSQHDDQSRRQRKSLWVKRHTTGQFVANSSVGDYRIDIESNQFNHVFYRVDHSGENQPKPVNSLTVTTTSGTKYPVEISWAAATKFYSRCHKDPAFFTIKPRHEPLVKKLDNWFAISEFIPRVQNDLDRIHICDQDVINHMISHSATVDHLRAVANVIHHIGTDEIKIDDPDVTRLLEMIVRAIQPVATDVAPILDSLVFTSDSEQAIVNEFKQLEQLVISRYPLWPHITPSKPTVYLVANYINDMYNLSNTLQTQ